MTTLAVYQPRVFPQLHWWNRMLQSDIFLLYDNAQFKQGSWQNRYEIIQNEETLLRTVPINRDDKFDPINQVRVDDRKRWRRKLKRSLSMNYQGKPGYDVWMPFLIFLISSANTLQDISLPFIFSARNYLDLDTKVMQTSQLDIKGEATEKLVEFCKVLDADRYLCGKTAYEDYMDLSRFKESNIEVQVQNWDCRYKYGNISIIDPLMRYGEQTKQWIS